MYVISKLVIKQKVKKLQSDLYFLRKQYSALSQIDMLSGEGNELLQKINVLRGEVDCLNWITKLKSNENIGD